MKFIHLVTVFTIVCFAFISCKKDKKNVSYTFYSFKGYTDKYLPDSPPFTAPIRSNDNNLYVRTSTEGEIEITLNTNETIYYTGKYQVQIDGSFYSVEKTPGEEITALLTFFPSDVVIFRYQSKTTSTGKMTSYNFLGTKQP